MIITGGEATGTDEWEDLTSVEVVSPSGVPLPCTVPPLPTSRHYHTQDGEVACGGDTNYVNTATRTSCVSLTASGWITSHYLLPHGNMGRSGHVSWSSPAGLLLMGGWLSRRTTELLSETSSSSSPSFDLEYDTV